MSQRHGGAFFMGQNAFFSASYGPWYAVAQPPIPEFRGPFFQRRPLTVRWMGQGEATPAAGAQPLTQAPAAPLVPASEDPARTKVPAPSLLTPTSIGIGAGILALAVGLVVLS